MIQKQLVYFIYLLYIIHIFRHRIINQSYWQREKNSHFKKNEPKKVLKYDKGLI